MVNQESLRQKLRRVYMSAIRYQDCPHFEGHSSGQALPSLGHLLNRSICDSDSVCWEAQPQRHLDGIKK